MHLHLSLVGIPFAIVLSECDFVGYLFATAVPVEQEWREKTVEASSVPSFIYKRYRELWPTREAVFFDYAGDAGFKIPGPSGKSTEVKPKIGDRKKVVSVSWIDRVLIRTRYLDTFHLTRRCPLVSACDLMRNISARLTLLLTLMSHSRPYMELGSYSCMAATALPRIAESRSTRRSFGAWGITLGIVVLFLVWLNVDASHTEVLGGTVAAVIAVIYGVLRNTGPVSITWAQIGFKRMAKCFRLMLQQLLKDSGVNAATATTRPVSNWICCHVGAIPMPCSSSFFCEVEEWLGTMLSRPAVGQGKDLNQLVLVT